MLQPGRSCPTFMDHSSPTLATNVAMETDIQAMMDTLMCCAHESGHVEPRGVGGVITTGPFTHWLKMGQASPVM